MRASKLFRWWWNGGITGAVAMWMSLALDPAFDVAVPPTARLALATSITAVPWLIVIVPALTLAILLWALLLRHVRRVECHWTGLLIGTAGLAIVCATVAEFCSTFAIRLLAGAPQVALREGPDLWLVTARYFPALWTGLLAPRVLSPGLRAGAFAGHRDARRKRTHERRA